MGSNWILFAHNLFQRIEHNVKMQTKYVYFLLNFSSTEGKRMSLHATMINASFRLVVVVATMQAKIAIHYEM